MSTKSRIAILSKTKMSANYICVGGFDIDNNRMLRLLGPRTERLTEDYPYEIGQLYEMTYAPKHNIEPPHSEDVAVYDYHLIDDNYEDFNELTDHLSSDLKNIRLDDLFDGKLRWENHKGYLTEEDNVDHSVEIATLNYPLRKLGDEYICGDIFNRKKVKYVGYKDISELPIVINAGTKIRFSLPRMWDRNNDGDRRSYLQLSGIYET